MSDAPHTAASVAALIKRNVEPSTAEDVLERNALRALALDPANVSHLEAFAGVCNEIERCNAQFARARQQLAVLVRAGEPLSPDRIPLERLCGLRED